MSVDNILMKLPDNVFAQLLSLLTSKEEGRLRRTCSDLYNRVTDISLTYRGTTRPLSGQDLKELPNYIIDSDIDIALSLANKDVLPNKEVLLKLSQRITKLELYKDIDETCTYLDYLLFIPILRKMTNLKEVIFTGQGNHLRKIIPQLVQSLASSLRLFNMIDNKWEEAIDLKLSNFEFNSLTHVELSIARAGDVSQLLINSKHTIKHLALHLDQNTNLAFTQHLNKLKKLKSLHLKGYISEYYGPGYAPGLPQILNACNKTLECLKIESLDLRPLATAMLNMNLRKLEGIQIECTIDNDTKGLLNLLTANSETLEHLYLDIEHVDFATLKADFKKLEILRLNGFWNKDVSNLTTLIKQAPNLDTLEGYIQFSFSELMQIEESRISLNLSRLQLTILAEYDSASSTVLAMHYHIQLIW